jgi:hypothetical protein
MRLVLALAALLLMPLACDDSSSSGSATCTPVEGGAACCADLAPTPEEIVCPEGAARIESEATGSIRCRITDEEAGLRYDVGPFLAYYQGEINAFGSKDAGGIQYACHENGLVQVKGRTTSEGGASCALECWDEEGQPTECEEPCE